MSDTTEITTLIDRYAAAPERLRHAVGALDAGALDRPEGGDGWTARQIVHHLADSEVMGATRLRQVLGEDGSAFAIYDQEGWARSLGYAGSDAAALEESLDLFALLRQSTARLLRQAPAERWDAWGTHPERGRMTLRDVVALYAGHGEIHLAQLQRAAGTDR